MTISVGSKLIHWNYFLALERDLDVVARYIEFSEPNFQVFSVELSRLLFAASSEVDVVAKQLCEKERPADKRDNITHYKRIILDAIPELPDTQVFVPRYGLSFRPWENWKGEGKPHWWESYNNVKHHRSSHFHEATLQNSLNAMGALLVLCLHFYARDLSESPGVVLGAKETTRKLQPDSCLLRLSDECYNSLLMLE